MISALWTLWVAVVAWDCGLTTSREARRLTEPARGVQGDRPLSRSADWGEFRIAVHYFDLSSLSSPVRESLRETVVPSAIQWYARLLQVHQITENWRLREATCGSAVVPSTHQDPGLPNVDFLVYISVVSEPEDRYRARGEHCAFDGGPIAGSIVFNAAFYRDISVETQVLISRHQFAHVLAFSKSLFALFPDYQSSNLLSNSTVRDNSVSLYLGKTAVAKAKSAFACADLPGIELATDNSHWSGRIIMQDFMTLNPGPEPVYSDITLAVFEDSGWYQVNYAYTGQIREAKERGCTFGTEKCVEGGVPRFPEFCTDGEVGACTFGRTHKALCNVEVSTTPVLPAFRYFENEYVRGRDQEADWCPYREAFDNGDCRGRGAIPTYSQSEYGEQICDSCLCFTGTYRRTGEGGPLHSGCHNVTCELTAMVTIGSALLSCPLEGGTLSDIPGFDGYVVCPPYSELCGARPCIHDCLGRGKCLNGECTCDRGYFGVDCGGSCDFSCLTCSLSGYFCETCPDNAAVLTTPGVCECVAGFFPAPDVSHCEACEFPCLECAGVLCTACPLQFVLSDSGQCQCPPGTYLDALDRSCSACHKSCSSCAGPTEQDCLSCSFQRELAGNVPSACECKPDKGTCGDCDSGCFLCKPGGACAGCYPHAHGKSPTFPTMCECDSGFFPASNAANCLPCHPSCATCSNFHRYACLSCLPSSVLVNSLYCAVQCPPGSVASGGKCTPGGSSEVLSVRFTDMQAEGATVTVKGTQAYYQQGWRFDGFRDSVTALETEGKRLIFGSTHTAQVWIRPEKTAGKRCFLWKARVELCLANSEVVLLDLLMTNIGSPLTVARKRVTGGEVAASREWTVVEYRVEWESWGSTRVVLAVNHRVVRTETLQEWVFEDTGGDVSIGQGGGSFFKGHITEVQVTNSRAENTVPACSCKSCTSAGQCLSECLADEYPSPSGCFPCPPSCHAGCLHPTSCLCNLDPLCKQFSSFFSCEACSANAGLSAGRCRCLPHSHLVSDVCQCLDGFQSDGLRCVACRNYFSPEDITASFDRSYTQISFAFSQPVDRIEYALPCAGLFLDTTLLGEGFTCSWANDHRAVVLSLGLDFQLSSSPIPLDSVALFATVGQCHYSARPISVTPQRPFNLPSVTARLSVPEVFYLACGDLEELLLDGAMSTGGVKHSLKFFWKLESEPYHSELAQFAAFQSLDPIVRIPKWALQAGTVVSVEMRVRNFLGSESVDRAVVTVSESRGFGVSGGGEFVVSSEAGLRVEASVSELCGARTQLQYAWSATSANFDQSWAFWPQSSTSNALVIPPKSLKSGFNYKFQVKAWAEDLWGTASFTVTVTTSPLHIVLDRIDSEISALVPFRVSSLGSSDPDDPHSVLSFAWACYNNSSPCLDQLGNLTVADEFEPVLTIPADKLIPGTDFKVGVTVKSGDKWGERWIAVKVSAGSAATFWRVSDEQVRISSHTNRKVMVGLTADSKVSLRWRQTGGPLASFLTPLDRFYFVLDSRSVVPGATYSFVLTASDSVRETSCNLAVSVATPPEGGRATISPRTGVALQTVFAVVAWDWVDLEGDYPLSYSWTYAYRGGQVAIGRKRNSGFRELKAAAGLLAFTVHIADSLGTSVHISLPTVVSAVSIEERDVLQSILSFEPWRLYEAVISHAYMFSLDAGVVEKLAKELQSYTSRGEVLDETEVDACVSTLEALLSQRSALTLSALQMLLGWMSNVIIRCPLTSRQGDYLAAIFGRLERMGEIESREIASFLAKVMKSVLDGALPGQVPTTYFAPGFFFYGQAMTPSADFTLQFSHSQLSLHLPTLPLTLPPPSPAACVLLVDSFAYSNASSNEVSISLYLVGSTANFQVEKYGPGPSLSVANLASPVLVGFPMRQFSSNASYECVWLHTSGNWTSEGTNLTAVRENYAECSTSRFGTFRVREMVRESLPSFHSDIPPPQPDPSACTLNYAPIALMSSLLVLGLCLHSYFYLADRHIRQIVPSPPTPQHFDFEAEPIDSKAPPHSPSNEVVFTDTSETTSSFHQSSFVRLFCESHCVLGLFVHSENLQRWAKGLSFCAAAMSEVAVVGALSQDQHSEDGAVWAVWQWYSVSHFVSVTASLAVGLLVGAACVAMFSKAAKAPKSRKWCWNLLGGAIAWGIGVLAFTGSVFVASSSCFAQGGQWAICAVQTILGEVAINQSIIGLGRAAVVKLLK